MHRPAAVAGQFYPARPQVLTRELERYLEKQVPQQTVIGCVVPHAGVMYSGHVAGAVYARLNLPPTVVILGPNHHGLGAPLAIMSEGAWETPLGVVSIDAGLAAAIRSACPTLEDDPHAHRAEHSLEVQLPFLQHLKPDLRIVPIALGAGSYEPLHELGEALGAVLATVSPRPLLVASTDLNHYEPESISRVKDHKAIDAILALDPRGLYDTVHRERITMCGYGPTVTMLTAARRLGAEKAQLIRYATSGDVTGDRTHVVGYAGLIVH